MKIYVGYTLEDRPSAEVIIRELRQHHTILDAFNLRSIDVIDERIRICVREADRTIVLCSTNLDQMKFRDNLLKLVTAGAGAASAFTVLLDGSPVPVQLQDWPRFHLPDLIAQNFEPLLRAIDGTQGAAGADHTRLPILHLPNPKADAPIGKRVADNALTAVETVKEVLAKDRCVVGSYFRWVEGTVNRMRDWADGIRRGLRGKAGEPSTYLFGGSSGSGKTFFVEEISAQLGTSIAFQTVDFSKDNVAKIKAAVEKIQEATQPTLFMIDEVDTKSADLAFYDHTFQLLEKNETAYPRVCVLLGSSPGGYQGVLAALAERPPKSCDMATRATDNCFDVPDAVLGDRLAFVAGQFQKNMPTLRPEVRRIDRLAAYYILSNGTYANARPLRKLLKRAMVRFEQRGLTKGLMYDDLHEPGDGQFQDFLTENHALAATWRDTYIRFE